MEDYNRRQKLETALNAAKRELAELSVERYESQYFGTGIWVDHLAGCITLASRRVQHCESDLTKFLENTGSG